MNAQEHGKKLITEARNIYNRDVKNAIEDNDYNVAVRRAQEGVELGLKGALNRTLSFYFEHGYSKEEAETASAEAEFVLAEIQKLLDE